MSVLLYIDGTERVDVVLIPYPRLIEIRSAHVGFVVEDVAVGFY